MLAVYALEAKLECQPASWNCMDTHVSAIIVSVRSWPVSPSGSALIVSKRNIHNSQVGQSQSQELRRMPQTQRRHERNGKSVTSQKSRPDGQRRR
jgi:hypothetical protein